METNTNTPATDFYARESKRLRRRYYSALAIVLTLLAGAFSLTQWHLVAFTEQGRLINEAGWMRALSQQLTKSALLLQHASTPEGFAARRKEFAGALESWHQNNQLLAEEVPEPFRASLVKLEVTWQVLTKAATEIQAQGRWSPAGGAEVPSASVRRLLQHEQQFFSQMDQLVDDLEGHFSERVQWLFRLKMGLVACLLLCLFLGMRYVFRPTARLLKTLSDSERAHQRERDVLQEELKMMGKTKGEFLARMSHELRTPMTAILGYTDLLRAGAGGPEDRAVALNTVHAQGVHLLGLIEDLLDLSAIDLGEAPKELISVDLKALVRVVERQMRPRAQERNLSLSIDIAPELPARVVSEPRHLRQVLTHLVDNAVKFTREGQVAVKIWTEDAAPDKSRLEPMTLHFEVSDTGDGIEEAELDRIFEPFTQGDESLTREHTGAGLGLAVCRHLSRTLGGDVTVTSAVGEGSTFQAHVFVSQDGGESCPPVETPIPFNLTPANPTSVLIVDDEPINRAVICAMLRHRGYTVEEAASGREGVDLAMGAQAAGRPFDLVLMDMEMPGMDGHAAATSLRASGYERPIVALLPAGEAHLSLPPGFDGVVSKPIRQQSLFKAISIQLAERSAAQ